MKQSFHKLSFNLVPQLMNKLAISCRIWAVNNFEIYKAMP